MQKLSFKTPDNKGKNNKKKIMILGGVTGLLVIVLIIVYVRLGLIKLPGSNPTATTVSKLPISSSDKQPPAGTAGVRTTFKAPSSSEAKKGNASLESPTPVNILNPFSGPFSLSGVIVNEAGKNIAIIDGNDKSYVVEENGTLDGTWFVEKISADGVILRFQDKRFSLTLPDNTR